MGAFVLLIATLGGFFVYWYAGSGDAREYKHEIYFEGSVSGLIRSTVLPGCRRRSRHRHPHRQACLGPCAGHRGHRFANADLEPHARFPVDAGRDRAALHRPAGECQGRESWLRCPAKNIRSSIRCNRISIACSSLPDLVGRATVVVDRAARVLSDENIHAFSKTMENIQLSSATLPGAMRDAAVVVADLRATLDVRRGHRRASAHRSFGPDLAAASERIHSISENLARTTANLDRLMTDHREDLGLFLRDSLPEIEYLRDSRSAAQEFSELSRSLKADPSQLLYEPSYKGVEIPR